MMKKPQLFILLLVVMFLLALADYRVNLPQGLSLASVSHPSTPDENPDAVPPVVKPDPNLTQQTLDASPELASYVLEKRTRSLELFETFDLSRVREMVVYKNILYNKNDANGFPLYIYEIQGEPGKGTVNFVNLKLTLINQLGSSSEALNETNQFGDSSLFYNDPLHPDTGYLLTLVNQHVFGFKYFKTSDQVFQDIQQFISAQSNLTFQ